MQENMFDEPADPANWEAGDWIISRDGVVHQLLERGSRDDSWLMGHGSTEGPWSQSLDELRENWRRLDQVAVRLLFGTVWPGPPGLDFMMRTYAVEGGREALLLLGTAPAVRIRRANGFVTIGVKVENPYVIYSTLVRSVDDADHVTIVRGGEQRVTRERGDRLYELAAYSTTPVSVIIRKNANVSIVWNETMRDLAELEVTAPTWEQASQIARELGATIVDMFSPPPWVHQRVAVSAQIDGGA